MISRDESHAIHCRVFWSLSASNSLPRNNLLSSFFLLIMSKLSTRQSNMTYTSLLSDSIKAAIRLGIVRTSQIFSDELRGALIQTTALCPQENMEQREYLAETLLWGMLFFENHDRED